MAKSRETSKPESLRPGRPRDPAADRAILQATLRVLTDQGYAGMSVEQVASEAGVGKTTIYRRYASKKELAAAAINAVREDWGPPPDTGSARTDIVEMLIQNQFALEQGPGFAMIGALLVEERRNPALIEFFRDRFTRPRRKEALMVLQRGVERGEIRADADLDIAIQAMVGAMFIRHFWGADESRERIEQTVEFIWRGLAANPRQPANGDQNHRPDARPG